MTTTRKNAVDAVTAGEKPIKHCPNCGGWFARDYDYCSRSCKDEFEHKQKLAAMPVSRRPANMIFAQLLAMADSFNYVPPIYHHQPNPRRGRR